MKNNNILLETLNKSKKNYGRKLRQNRNKNYAVHIVTALYSELGTIVKKEINKIGNQFNCKEGCTPCCSLRVEVLAPEVFYITNIVKRSPPKDIKTILDKLKKQAAYAKDKTKEEYYYPCAFLHNNSCSIYESRPYMCRKLFSFDVEKCKNEPRIIPESEILLLASQGLGAGFIDAFNSINLHAEPTEFSQAITLVLNDDTALERWYRSEEVFEKLP